MSQSCAPIDLVPAASSLWRCKKVAPPKNAPGKTGRWGRLQYPNRSLEIPFDEELRRRLLVALADVRHPQKQLGRGWAWIAIDHAQRRDSSPHRRAGAFHKVEDTIDARHGEHLAHRGRPADGHLRSRRVCESEVQT